jgi:hypothetical protein
MDNGFVQDSYVDPGLPAYVETDFDLEYLTIPLWLIESGTRKTTQRHH